MRLVYLDEAGISNPAQESHLVVAGVMVSPDRQWNNLENYFRELHISIFPENADEIGSFIFHAKDIWHGSGAFDRERFPRKERMRILMQLAQVPRLFQLPVFIGAIDRVPAHAEILAENPQMTDKSVHHLIHMMAFINAVQGVEYWMNKNSPDEVAMLIAEDSPLVKSTMKNLHGAYADRSYTDSTDAFTAPHVIDTIHFAMKDESVLLQIADHCAFIAKRHIMGKTDVGELFEAIKPSIEVGRKEANGFLMRTTVDKVRLVET